MCVATTTQVFNAAGFTRTLDRSARDGQPLMWVKELLDDSVHRRAEKSVGVFAHRERLVRLSSRPKDTDRHTKSSRGPLASDAVALLRCVTPQPLVREAFGRMLFSQSRHVAEEQRSVGFRQLELEALHDVPSPRIPPDRIRERRSASTGLIYAELTACQHSRSIAGTKKEK